MHLSFSIAISANKKNCLASKAANDYYKRHRSLSGAANGGRNMSQQQKVIINGVAYDAHSGLRIENEAPVVKPAHHAARSVGSHAVHKKPSKSHTLSRAHVSTPEGHDKAKSKTAPSKKTVPTHPMVRRFSDVKPASNLHAKHHIKKETPRPIAHPMQKAVAHRTKPSHPAHHAPKPRPAHTPAKVTKQHAIEKALQNAAPAHAHKKRSFAIRHPRLASAGTASLAIVLMAGYFTYINLPSLSVRVAAAQAGIDASYPGYQPAGYGIKGPVAYDNGEVSISFKSNTNPHQFSVNQSKSSWDSSALLANYVMPQSSGDYISYSDSGLTIYAYGTQAAWVNGGILHTIEGDANLSGEQIRRIATSM
jgi:hypothetical protein